MEDKFNPMGELISVRFNAQSCSDLGLRHFTIISDCLVLADHKECFHS